MDARRLSILFGLFAFACGHAAESNVLTAKLNMSRGGDVLERVVAGPLRVGDDGEVVYAGYGFTDQITATYDGNRLLKVKDYMEEVVYGDAFDFHDGADEDVEYDGNGNGNMTADLNRGIKEITYDVNNRPLSVTFSTRPAEQRTKYLRDASGRKLRTTYQTSRFLSLGPDDLWHVDTLELNPGIWDHIDMGGLRPLSSPGIGGAVERWDDGKVLPAEEALWSTSYVRDYCGDIIYKDGEVERILTDNGYAVPDSAGGYDYYYYVKDWQGNVRAVIDEANRRMELNNYYPYGMPMSSTASVQPYKYGGKELDRTNGLDMYDFHARWYDMIVPHFITIDPLAEKYPSISPYVYCAGNPIRYVDYRGDSISLAPIQKLDQTLNSNFTQTILSDLNNITGLSLTVSSDGILTYKNQIGEKAEGSMTARNMLIAAIENKDMVSVMTAHRSASPIGKNEIWLGIRQIDNFINGASNVNKLTLGWGMTFLHELLHTNVGGALQDFPYNPGPVVEIMNTIRSELNGNFGQRMQYNAKAINGSSYIPFDDLSDSFLRNGLSPHPNSMFIKF